ncbi:CRISPR-associated helicase Cas3' [Isachenkonia alkalipeptolytica]|uniref:CRISPR-associated helicase Cas3 n=1 Tax=Isachenkonia alkalipeptolytica TaxID=2565777 RepID=A0AA43XID5_9CLOT|nr:CRISPR-associated helicase Cas3' [Isachenkonia alkalipeptolytica]NBG87368.1 CRISPR-associated helicase Cas3' [Isachenkonia alkalipeptolytica]
MCASYKLYSHRDPSKSTGDQLLADHLKGVAAVGRTIVKRHGFEKAPEEELLKVVDIMSLCHDFGKGSEYFQDYLQEKYYGDYKNHGEISAYLAYDLLPQKWKLLGFMAVKRHHGDMTPGSVFFNQFNQESLIKICDSLKRNQKELEKLYGRSLNDFFQKIQDRKFLRKPLKEFLVFHKSKEIESFLWLHYFWSILLTADKTQVIRRGNLPGIDQQLDDRKVEYYLDILRKDLVLKNPAVENSLLYQMRQKIYLEGLEGIKALDIEKERILSINVPTGTGKTLTAYGVAFRLAHRLRKEKDIQPKIIYTLPFTSVIDQNYGVLEDVLIKNNIAVDHTLLLKHHSFTEIDYHSKEEGRHYREYDGKFFVENWQSTVITTTFVQLFNTIFQPGRNKISHRFHNLAGAIIILDEVQAIDPKFYDVIEAVFKTFSKLFNCYIITVTATKPLFLEGKELINQSEEHFKALDRIEIHNHMDQKRSIEEFLEILQEDIAKEPNKSFLIVMNTVKSAKEVYKTLQDVLNNERSQRDIKFLSTEIYPKRRLELIEEIRTGNNDNQILVSTQLIEAGVDIDFDRVYRDFAPMDSINQTAGRCNRSGVKGKGIVRLYKLKNIEHNDKIFAGYIYSEVLLSITEKILKDRKIIQEREIYDINQQYFKKTNEKRGKDTSQDLLKAIYDFRFDTIRDKFQLIEDQSRIKEDLIINIDDNTQNDIALILSQEGSYGETMNAWIRLNQYKVSVPRKDLDQINDHKYFEHLRVVDKEDYDELGVKRKEAMIF